MQKPMWWESSRLEVLVALLIAIVSLTTAFSVWRTNTVGSSASDESRQGLIDAVKKQAFANENWRKAYQEAAFAHSYAIDAASAETLAASSDPAAQAQAKNIKKYLLPNMQLLAAPLAVDKKYARSDGTYDIQKRFDDLQAESKQVDLDPQASFKRADSLFAQQRWLVVGSVLLAISLFWLGLAQISGARKRFVTMLIGLLFYGLGLVWFLGVEAIFLFLRRGGL
jgi:hypothetical protein